MDAENKIIQFDTYDALISEIKRDLQERSPLHHRYPVRFIMLNNFNVFTKLAQELAPLGVQPLNIEDLIEQNHDRWITSDEFVEKIRRQTNTTLVTPFSELIRFYKDSDFNGLMNEIMLLENIESQTKRIYIPLIGLQNRFTNFLNGFARIEESAPIWAYLEEEHKTDVFLNTFKVKEYLHTPISNLCCIDTVYDWLRFWKSQAPQTKIIVLSKPICHRSKYSVPDNVFTFRKIENAYQFINLVMDINIPFNYFPKEDSFWEHLLMDIMTKGCVPFNFPYFVSNRFNFVGVIPKDILLRWVQEETKDYDRWLIKNFFLESPASKDFPYFTLCMKELTDYDSSYELIRKIVERIFYFPQLDVSNQSIAEREKLITSSSEIVRNFTDENTQSYIKEQLYEIAQSNVPLALSLCTGEFEFEKILLATWYANREFTGLTLKEIKGKFPQLYMYLSDIGPSVVISDNWHKQYLSAYRNAKLLDDYTQEIKTFIDEKNHDDNSFYAWYHKCKETRERLIEHMSNEHLKPDKVYWIDALGAEFLPYILSMFHEIQNYQVLYSEITRCTIPSATAQNRFEGAIKYEDLDAIAHDNKKYQQFSTLIRELQVLYDKIHEIVDKNSSGAHTIAIVSDHGLSCLSRKIESKKYDIKVKHEGRYIESNGKNNGLEGNYVKHKNEHDGKYYQIALTHASLKNKPTHEVHGGCTPEEVLVPYVIITNRTNIETKYECKLLTLEIEKSNPRIVINIMPQPSEVNLEINGGCFKLTRKGNDWSTILDNIDEGTYEALFIFSSGYAFNTSIKVIGTAIDGNDFLNF